MSRKSHKSDLDKAPFRNPLKWMVRNLGATAVAGKLGVNKGLIHQWMLEEVPVPDDIAHACRAMVRELSERIRERELGHEDPVDLVPPPDITEYIWSGDGPATQHHRNRR